MMKMWSIFPDAVAGAVLEGGGEAGAPDDDVVALDGGGGEELVPSKLERIELAVEVEAEGVLGAAGAVVLEADAGGELEPPDDVRPKTAARAARRPELPRSVLLRIETLSLVLPCARGPCTSRTEAQRGAATRRACVRAETFFRFRTHTPRSACDLRTP
jgi:hypothetical protein